ncbi:MAG: SPFH domain-containing protein, partial [Acidihalobacter sp.]
MKLKILAVVVVLGLLVLSMSAYTVKQSQTAILVKLGQIKKADIKPGLHWKWPLIEQVKIFDHRILTMDAQPERFLTSEKKNVIVDYYVKWRIANVNRYYRRTLGDEIKAQSTLS